MLAHGEIERFSADVILDEVGGDIGNTGGERRRQRRMCQVGGDQTFERADQLMDALGRQIEFEELNRNEPFAFRIVGPEHWSKSPRTDLMKNTKRSECVWRRGAGSFRVQ